MVREDILPLSVSKRNIFAQLWSKKMRLKHNLFIVEGKKSIVDLVSHCSDKFRIKYLLATQRHIDDCLSLSESYLSGNNSLNAVNGIGNKVADTHNDNSFQIYLASEEDIKRISSLASLPGIIAICELPEALPEDEIYSQKLEKNIYLMLDGIQDPGNLGTIIRTSHWFGIKRIFASKDTVDLYNPKVVQASMGSLASVEIDYVDLKKLVTSNPEIPVYGLLLEGKNLFKSGSISSGFIVMGNEGNGISEGMRKLINYPLTIPPYYSSDHSESLNVAIATAITLAHIRQ